MYKNGLNPIWVGVALGQLEKRSLVSVNKNSPRSETRKGGTPGPLSPRAFKVVSFFFFIGAAITSVVVGWRGPFNSGLEFDEKRAMEHLIRQVSFGPRVPGSKAHRECLAYITTELETYLPSVRHHRFSYNSAALGAKLEGTNILATARGRGRTQGNFLMLCAHWDSRPVADMDPDLAKRGLGVPGANDGASGVAILLEVARILGQNPPRYTVEIVLFDMEDMGGLPPTGPLKDPYCIGSKRFVEDHPEFRPKWGILLDMVGKKGLRIPKERLSLAGAPDVVDFIWSIARRLQSQVFVDEVGPLVVDDHVPFLERGIKVVNLIDLYYPQWHTLDDLPEQCSPQSLKAVGEVVLKAIYNAE